MKRHCLKSSEKNSLGEYGHQMDNSYSTIQRLSTLYSEQELSDLKLYVGEKVFLTHKLILSISSDVFKTMLTNPTWPEAYEDEVHLQEEGECQEVFGDFLHYLYTGRIHMSHGTVLPVLSLADKYNIGDLSVLCIDYMCCHYVVPREQSRVVTWYNYALMCGHKKLQQVCEEYILWNFEYVSETPDFLSAPVEVLVQFLKSPNLVVKSEHCVYMAMKRWLTAQKAPTHTIQDSSVEWEEVFDRLVKQISHHIRFSLMSCSELEILKGDSLVSENPDILESPIKAAIELRETHPQEERRPSAEHANKQMNTYTSALDKLMHGRGFRKDSPRIYTCDSWCTEVTIKEVDSVLKGEVLGAFFSTPVTGWEEDDANHWDWHVDLYPNGVNFKKCMMIGVFENSEIDEVNYETVRITVTSNIPEKRKVLVTVLVFGHQNGMEYVAKGITKTCFFDKDIIVHNLNDVVPYGDIHCKDSTFKVGNTRDTLKIMLVIRPTADMP